jgi:hypothetical protein
MANGDVSLDHKGIAAMLKTPAFHAVVNEAAAAIQSAARELVGGTPVPMHEYTSDRAAASVSVLAPMQAKHGALTKAAANVGLEVKDKK